jgi:hypothetical protein
MKALEIMSLLEVMALFVQVLVVLTLLHFIDFFHKDLHVWGDRCSLGLSLTPATLHLTTPVTPVVVNK